MDLVTSMDELLMNEDMLNPLEIMLMVMINVHCISLCKDSR